MRDTRLRLQGGVVNRDINTDGDKLDGIEAGATADQTDAEIETAYNNQVSVVSQAEAEAGASTTVRRWTAERVGQAVSALGGTVDTSGTPIALDYAKFTDGNTIEGRSYAEVKQDLDLEIGVDVQAWSTVLDNTTASFTTADETKLDNIEASANNYSHPNHTGDVTSTGDGATVIADEAVTLAKMQHIATDSFLGRDTAATGDVEVLSAATARSVLNVADGANAYSHPNHSGHVTSSGDGATTLTVSAITGQTDIGADIADTDELIINDGGSIRRTDMSRVKTYVAPQLETPTATTSGTSVDITGVPAGVTRVTILFNGFSHNGTSQPMVQLGDSGGIETTGYIGQGSHATLTGSFNTGFELTASTVTASWLFYGVAYLYRTSSGANTWLWHGHLSDNSSGDPWDSSGYKSLSGELTTIRLTTIDGVPSFDAGEINVIYE